MQNLPLKLMLANKKMYVCIQFDIQVVQWQQQNKTMMQSSFVDALSSNPMSVQYAPPPTEGI